jgi:hypothetical protein
MMVPLALMRLIAAENFGKHLLKIAANSEI